MLACSPARAAEEPPHSAELDAMIIKAAQRHGVPERLVRRVVMRESRYNPQARNHRYWGLMQISYPTAKSMGFKGTPEQLLNPVTNLTYAVPYLANAFIAAGKREDAAIRLYASGYYDTARRRGLLGTLRTAESAPASGNPDDPRPAVAAAEPSLFGSLFGTASAPEAPPMAAANVPVPPAAMVASDDQAVARKTAPSGSPLPTKWRHDGGVTTLARGEQATDHSTARQAEGGRHARKSTAFAALDDVPSTAQAYSAANTAAPPQAAIAQAIAGQPPAEAVAAGADAKTAEPSQSGADQAEKPIRKGVKHVARVKAGVKSATRPSTKPVASADAPAVAAVAELKR